MTQDLDLTKNTYIQPNIQYDESDKDPRISINMEYINALSDNGIAGLIEKMSGLVITNPIAVRRLGKI